VRAFELSEYEQVRAEVRELYAGLLGALGAVRCEAVGQELAEPKLHQVRLM
jgi:hypothetical protein